MDISTIRDETMKKKDTGMGLLIPKKMRMGGMTLYRRQGQVIGRVSEPPFLSPR